MSYHLQVIAKTRDLIVEEAKETAEIIERGVAVKDFASYKEHAGRLYAYKRALELFEEAAKMVGENE